eukprot:jgi/Astpho2/2689/gw1.00050.167.1_t
MAYGQTGSGKTHTLLGDLHHAQRRGIVPRAVSALAAGLVVRASPSCSLQVTMSSLEIYCEKIRDLLDCSNSNLQVKQDPCRGITVAGATEVPISSQAEAMRVLQHGIANRAVASTAMNAESSRSHCIVTLAVQQMHTDGKTVYGKLCLVDLAGTERSGKTVARGQTLEEAKLINKSLSALGNVVNALTDAKKMGHIPYRDSKLTRVLQDSLGGSARTALIVCCSPSSEDAAETLSSLRFGSR